MQLNYDFVICVVTYYHPIKINVIKSKKEMKSLFFLCMFTPNSNFQPHFKRKVSFAIFHEESICFASSLFLIGFHFKFN